jgi:DNA-binding transcriptional regulator YdaS (Cro superfamily)
MAQEKAKAARQADPPSECRAEFARTGVPKYLIAARVGVHPVRLSQFLHGHRPMPAALYERIMRAIADEAAAK